MASDTSIASMNNTPLLEQGRFPNTHWTMVLAAGAAESPNAREALENLCRDYWFPLYCFIRRLGCGQDDAQDLTQGYFERLLEKNYLAEVHPDRGRFRTFLLKGVKNYFLDEKRRESRAKRGGDAKIVSFDDVDAEGRYLAEPETGVTPETMFERQWAAVVIENAVETVRREFHQSGKKKHFDRLKPFLATQPETGDYEKAAQDLGCSANAVGVAVHRMRARYARAVREEVAHTVHDPRLVEDEVRHLFRVLSEG